MKKPKAHVTDHAVLRYLERVHGIDIDAVREEVSHLVDLAVEMGAGAVVVDGLKYVLRDEVVITAAPVKSTPLPGRYVRPRRREIDDEGDWEGQP